ncbi:MAG TPA: hypothetical protein VFL55_14540 [Acetobacteraceae bacterium]|nr:hypothetical protein [Acetobacteraceae bacterium]
MKWLLGLICLTLLAPLALVDVPPLLDYPNHLARAVVLAAGAADPVLSRMYAPHWTIIPNLGIDLVLPPLLRLLPVHVAGRIVIGVAVLLPVFGTVAYSRAVFGTLSAWPFAAALVAYNGALLLGFLNFVAGIGLALLLASVWIIWRERHPAGTAALASAGMAALFFCHLTSAALCALLIAGYETECLWRQPTLSNLLKRAAAVAFPFAVPVALYLLSPLTELSNDTVWSSFTGKLAQLLLPFANYDLRLDIFTAGLVYVLLLIARCRIPLRSGLPIAVLLVLFAMSPSELKGVQNFDARFAIILGFLLFGAARPTGLPRAAIVAIALLFAVRMTVLAQVWLDQRRDLAEFRSVIAAVEPGAHVFVAKDPDAAQLRLSNGMPLNDHMPAILLIERRAFWPFLFDNPSQQPIETLQPYRDLALRAGAVADARDLGHTDLCGYDYVLLFGPPDGLAQFVSDRLQLLDHAGFAALFRIRPSHCAS